jgi:RNA polymerase sporulation-specific sigma factor
MAGVGRVGLPPSYPLMRDEEVIAHAQAGSVGATEHLLRKYRPLVEGKARAYYLVGAEHEDVVQEGMIGLYKAIRDFSEHGLSAFRSFAELCVTRQIISAVKSATRRKHQVFNTCLSLDAPPRGEDTADWRESLVDPAAPDPQEVVLARGYCAEILGSAQEVLSDFEAGALSGYLQGLSYRIVARGLGCNVKQIDNALQRAKHKLTAALANHAAPVRL